ncbi:hypothetical protein BKA69DRAFT_1085510 [Paraphysoderma sedebokerense]|nr:hypothetical protein BKA69DRAFT_1085510 [Paraphysoderma sedebokerense]
MFLDLRVQNWTIPLALLLRDCVCCVLPGLLYLNVINVVQLYSDYSLSNYFEEINRMIIRVPGFSNSRFARRNWCGTAEG